MKPIPFNFEVETLLESCGLPTDDLRDGAPIHLFGDTRHGLLVGVVGVENYRESGLLRSLAVDQKYRGSGIGHELVAYAEEFALRSGLRALYLLTTTAAVFFDRLGYKSVPRDEAPAAIAATAEFADLCPSTATLMVKPLTATAPVEATSL